MYVDEEKRMTRAVGMKMSLNEFGECNAWIIWKMLTLNVSFGAYNAALTQRCLTWPYDMVIQKQAHQI